MLPDQQMGARQQRDTTTALELLTEQIHMVWARGVASRWWIASMLCLDMAGAFDNASHKRLIHILQNKGIPTRIVQWVGSFLSDRWSSLTIDTQTSNLFPVQNSIPQGSPVSPILFLFFNEELVRSCNQSGLKVSAVRFIDDINILAWGESTEHTCQTLSRIHNTCLGWARRHGATFEPSKYELIHLTQSPNKFNLQKCITFGATTVHPKTEVWVLRVYLDPALKWGPHINKIKEKMSKQTLALTRTATSTWGATFKKAKQVYTTVV